MNAKKEAGFSFLFLLN